MISVSESESGSEGRSQVGKTPSSGTKPLQGPKRTFDPCGSSDTAKQSLPADMVDYVDKNFRKFIDNKIINEKILELHPIPGNALSLSVPEVDDYVHEIFVCLFVLFDLILYVHSTIFQLCGTVLPGFNQY